MKHNTNTLGSPTHDRPSPSSTSVIVADDQAVARQGTCQLLQNTAGIDVPAAAASRSEALRLVQEDRPDVLVTEAKFPDGLGTELAERLRTRDLTTDVLILSAYREMVYLKSFLDTEAAGYLLKRDDCALLIEAIRGIRDGERGWFSRSVASRLLTLRNATLPSTGRAALTSRESELLKVLAEGLTNREIAARVDLSVGTVKNYLTGIYEKLDVPDRAKAIVWAHEDGLSA
jgi:DNA-binding NarL/FixJ family response regulator